MPNDDHHALVVGIEAYANFDGLFGPVNDARHFIEWLEDPAGGDVPSANITTILTDGAPTDPSFDAVVDGVARYIEDFESGNGAPLGRRLYIYLAGHGINVGDLGDCGLMVANASFVTSHRNLPGKLLARKFRSSCMFDEVILLMDCCREVIPNNPSGQLQVLQRLQTVGGGGTVVEGLATKWDRLAREKELPNPDGVGSSIQGLFTHAVIDGLRRAVDDSGAVTAERLRDYVREYTLRLGAEDQTTEITVDPDDVVICRPPDPRTTVYVTVNRPDTDFDVRTGDYQLVQPLDKTPTPSGAVAVRLVPAKYVFGIPAGRPIDGYDAVVTWKVLGREDDVAIG